jgi:predicted ester cyclase
MGIEENKAIVQRFLDEVVGRGDMAAAVELCTPDSVNHAAAPDRQRGVENIKAVLEFSRHAQPDQRWVEQYFVAEGDLVVVYGRREGTWQASSFRGVNTPSGTRVSVELAHMFRLHDGKIAEHWAVRDDLGMMQQLGVI